MKATGTQRQLAVLAAFRVKPEASQSEIARAVGVSQAYASLVIRDYLESKAKDQSQACQVPARTKPAAVEKDIACFALDRRIGGNTGPAACTVKQQAVNVALAENPRQDGEAKMRYCKRMAAIAGVSYSTIQQTLIMRECEAIGAAVRAREAEEAKNRCEVMPAGIGLGPVTNFRGWLDFFSKLKILTEAYLLVAQSRGDVYAAAFLKDVRDTSDRAATSTLYHS
jgi:hypothetical protein